MTDRPPPSCCGPEEKDTGCCQVLSIVSVDERGQMVLPKDVRTRAGITPGDRLAVVSWEKDGAVCCLTLIRVEEFSPLVKELLGPVIKPLIHD